MPDQRETESPTTKSPPLGPPPRIFLSHATEDNTITGAFATWLNRNGFSDFFLDFGETNGLKDGAPIEETIEKALYHCCAVIFLVSPFWLNKRWCQKEHEDVKKYNEERSRQRPKHESITIFYIVIQNSGEVEEFKRKNDKRFTDLTDFASSGNPLGDETYIDYNEVKHKFSSWNLRRLKNTLEQAALADDTLPWPPADDVDASPYCGLQPFTEDHGAVFFERESEINTLLAALKLPPKDGSDEGQKVTSRIVTIIGPTGCGKTSLLRAGVLSRIRRLKKSYVVLPIIDGSSQIITGPQGLAQSVLQFARLHHYPINLSSVKEASVPQRLGALLVDIAETVLRNQALNETENVQIIIPVDGIKPFGNRLNPELDIFIETINSLLVEVLPARTRLFGFALIFTASDLDWQEIVPRIPQNCQSRIESIKLRSLYRGQYQTIITSIAARHNLAQSQNALRRINLGPGDAAEIANDAEKDNSISLLAHALQVWYLHSVVHDASEGPTDTLRLTLRNLHQCAGNASDTSSRDEPNYRQSIAASADRALKICYGTSDQDGSEADLNTLFVTLIAANIDNQHPYCRQESKKYVTQITKRMSKFVECLLHERLLIEKWDANDDGSGELKIQISSPEVIRHWPVCCGWVKRNSDDLVILESINLDAILRKRECGNGHLPSWKHLGRTIKLSRHQYFRLRIESHQGMVEYIDACKRQRLRLILLSSCAAVGVIGTIVTAPPLYLRYSAIQLPAEYFLVVWKWVVMPPTPEVISLAAGSFEAGCKHERDDTLPGDEKCKPDGSHRSTIGAGSALGKYEVTYEEYDYYVLRSRIDEMGGNSEAKFPSGSARMQHPVANVTWDEANSYLSWLSKQTGDHWRLPSADEWEYAARGAIFRRAWWPDGPAKDIKLNCKGCKSDYYLKTAPAGTYQANPWAFHDTAGNVAEWVANISDGENLIDRHIRGGSYQDGGAQIIPASDETMHRRDRQPFVGFRALRQR